MAIIGCTKIVECQLVANSNVEFFGGQVGGEVNFAVFFMETKSQIHCFKNITKTKI